MADFWGGRIGGALSDLGNEAVRVWGGGMPGDPSNPAKVERRRKMTDALLGNATNTGPVPGTGGWDSLAQGMSRVVSGLAYGRRNYVSDEQERLGQEAATSAFNTAREGGLSREELADLVVNQPWMTPQQLKGAELLLPQDPMKVGEDEVLIDPNTHEQLYPKPGPGGTQRRAKLADVMKIRDDIQNSPGFKAYNTSVPAIASMEQSIRDPAKVTDLDFLYGLSKIMDPTTGVKEGEQAAIWAGMSPLDWIKASIAKITEGHGLPTNVKQDLYRLAYRRVQAMRAQAEYETRGISELIKRYNIAPEDVPGLMDLPPAPAVPATTEEFGGG